MDEVREDETGCEVVNEMSRDERVANSAHKMASNDVKLLLGYKEAGVLGRVLDRIIRNDGHVIAALNSD